MVSVIIAARNEIYLQKIRKHYQVTEKEIEVIETGKIPDAYKGRVQALKGETDELMRDLVDLNNHLYPFTGEKLQEAQWLHYCFPSLEETLESYRIRDSADDIDSE